MDLRDFNQVAIDIIVKRPPTGPAAYRSAISRAYYAAFNVATNVLDAIGHSPGKGDSQHKKVVIYLQQSGDVALESVGRYIDMMRLRRNQADYEMANTTVETMSTARDMAETARKIIEDLDGFAADPVRERLAADAIAEYKVKTSTP
ncbi:MAG: HEPN domain-containing protein [Isosphaeraceae bacterium]